MEEAFSLLDKAIETIIAENVLDAGLISHVGVVAKELGCDAKVLHLYEKLCEKNPKNKEWQINLFNSYCGENEYYKMYMQASKIASNFKEQAFQAHAQLSLYLFAKSGIAPPGTIDMAFMSIAKLAEGPLLNRGVADLYLRVLQDKNMHEKAIEFIEAHHDLYPLVSERRRLIMEILAKGMKESACIDLLLTIIRENYKNAK